VNSIRATLLICLAGIAAAAPTGCRRPLADRVNYSESNVALLRTALGGENAVAQAPVALAEPTGWATLKGVFKLNGAAPAPTPINVTSDHSVCMAGGKAPPGNDIVIDAGGGIANVFIYLETKYPEGNSKWEHSGYAAAPKELIFDQKSCVFLTHAFAMRTSQTLKVLNSDPVGHNTKLEGQGDARPGNFTVPAGGSAVYSPGGEATEPFKVACNIHPWMAAYGLVRKNPYFAVTKAGGEFEIPNLPSDVPLRFRVWHERLLSIREIRINGAIDKFSRGRLDVKLNKDEQRELELVVDASLFK
jgi:hypothetical protein